MKVAVWDTYVTKSDGKVMHFDIIVPAEIADPSKIYEFGQDYLKSKGHGGLSITSEECEFCHFETIKPDWKSKIDEQGYYIIEMENCK
jgi:hypothetical protein